MEEITTLGIDLAKRVFAFALQGVNASGRVVLRRVSDLAFGQPDQLGGSNAG